MARVIRLAMWDGTDYYDFRTRPLRIIEGTWRTQDQRNGVTIETFEIGTSDSATVAQVMGAVNELDEFGERCRLYWANDRYDNPVVFQVNANGEGAKQALVYDIDILPVGSLGISQALQYGMAVYRCQIQRMTTWESASATADLVGEATVSTLAGTTTVNAINGTLPARNSEIQIYHTRTDYYLDKLWVGIKPKRDGVFHSTSYDFIGEVEDYNPRTDHFRTNPNKVLFYDASGTSYTDLSNVYDDVLTTSSSFTLEATPSVDYLYIGFDDRPFNVLSFLLVTGNTNSATLDVETSHAGGFASVTSFTDNTADSGVPFDGDGEIWYTPANAWAKQTVSTYGSKYWIRISTDTNLTQITLYEIYGQYNARVLDSGTGASPDDTAYNAQLIYLTETDYESGVLSPTLSSLDMNTTSARGRYLVLLRYRMSADMDISFRVAYGDVSEDYEFNIADKVYLDYGETVGNTNWHLVPVGEITIPPTPIRATNTVIGSSALLSQLLIYVTKVSGASDAKLYIDSIIFMPSEHMIYLGDDINLTKDSGTKADTLYIYVTEDEDVMAFQTSSTKMTPIVQVGWEFPIEGGEVVVAGEYNDGSPLSANIVFYEWDIYHRYRTVTDPGTT